MTMITFTILSYNYLTLFSPIQMLREKFAQFAADTETIGQERVAEVNEVCDALIADGHADADTIAEWKVTPLHPYPTHV